MATRFPSRFAKCARGFVLACCGFLPVLALAQAPITAPPAPIPGQRPPPPTGTIAPPGFSIDVLPGPSSAAEAARAATGQMASATFSPATTRVGRPVEYSVRFFANERVIELPGLKPPPGLQLDAANPRVSPSGIGTQLLNTFPFSARPLHAGEFTIPRFEVEVGGKRIVIPEATLVAVESDPNDTYQPLRAVIDLPKRDFLLANRSMPASSSSKRATSSPNSSSTW
jgi:hypothetical protein